MLPEEREYPEKIDGEWLETKESLAERVALKLLVFNEFLRALAYVACISWVIWWWLAC